MTDTKKTKAEEAKIKKERSTAYPGIALEQAVTISKKLIESYGKSPFSRENAVQALGFKAGGSSFTKVAALVHYGLLARKGNSYENSGLGERVAYFQSDEDLKGAIAQAALTPRLFTTLANDYSGRAIPGLLKNILITQHKINRNVADDVATIFKDSLEYAGLYVNGIVASVTDLIPAESKESISPQTAMPSNSKPVMFSREASAMPKIPAGMQSVTLPSGIVISYPSEVAYLFALGKFGTQIEALEKAVNAALKKNDDGTTTPSAE